MPARFTTASNVPATATRSSRNANRRTFSASSYGSFSGPATSTTLGGGRKTRRAAQPRQVRSTGQQYAAQPCGADPLAAVVADDDLVRDDRAAQPLRCTPAASEGDDMSDETVATRGDERHDLIVGDTNKDGKADLWATDTDGDGKPDLFQFDPDGDGKVDITMVDLDQDGTPETVVDGDGGHAPTV